MNFVRDSRLIDGHIARWTYAMDFVRNLGCYHSGAAPTGFANRICSHIADRICEPDLWPWKVPVLEYYRIGVASTGFADWICRHIANRICEAICGPGGSRIGVLPQRGSTHRVCEPICSHSENKICKADMWPKIYVVRKFCLIDGYNLNYGLAR